MDNGRKGHSWLAQFGKSALRVKTYDVDRPTNYTTEEGLVRRLGVFDLILLGIGASVGAGIFVVTGTVARDAGPGAASIARSLASYLVTILQLFPSVKEHLPKWLGPGGMELFGGFLSINLLAPILLIVLTLILCQGVRESSTVNAIMTTIKVVIVLLIIFSGAFEIDVSNWTPFAPNGVKAIVTGATVVFFAYVGFDAVANSAEECRKPKRDLPIGILVSLLVCAALYIGVCLVLTGMVSYKSLGGDAPLAEAFSAKGLKLIVVLVSVGAVAGLTTTLLVGLYVQSRLYLGLGRDGLLPSIFAKIHPKHRTPIHSQIWVGTVAGVLAGLFDVSELSHILSVGTLSGYSVVSACVIMLRVKSDVQIHGRTPAKGWTKWREAVTSIFAVACCAFVSGLCYRFGTYFIYPVVLLIMAVFIAVALHYRQEYTEPPGFSCPSVPLVPLASVFINIFLFAQLHWEAWVRFVVLSTVSIFIYALYGQYHADPDFPTSGESRPYQRAPTQELYEADA